MGGWIKLHRSITEHRHYRQKRVFSDYEAWLDLLIMANHATRDVDVEGTPVTVIRGSTMTSVRRLCDRWRWSNTKVQNYLYDCVAHGEIVLETRKRLTMIYIVNYEKYQSESSVVEENRATTKTTTKTTTENDDFFSVNTRDSDESDDDQKRRLKRQQKRRNNNDIKEDIYKDILSVVTDVVSFLNETCNTRYTVKSEKTRRFILSRLNDGFTLDDFKRVIVSKQKDWGDDDKMSQYLRPETLFGTKFEGYLQVALKLETDRKSVV